MFITSAEIFSSTPPPPTQLLFSLLSSPLFGPTLPTAEQDYIMEAYVTVHLHLITL